MAEKRLGNVVNGSGAARNLRRVTAAATLVLAASATSAQDLKPLPRPPADKAKVLELYRGTWDVRTRTREPRSPDVTSTESWTWVLDRRFLRGDTGVKSDGGQEIVMATYDPNSRGFPFWVFSSSGLVIYLEPAQWDERTRTLEWKSGPSSKISYLIRCSFPDARTRQCVTTAKDWKGRLLLAQESSAVRRGP